MKASFTSGPSCAAHEPFNLQLLHVSKGLIHKSVVTMLLQSATVAVGLWKSVVAGDTLGRKEGRFTHPWQPARLIGWNSVWVGQCDISAMTSCQGRL